MAGSEKAGTIVGPGDKSWKGVVIASADKGDLPLGRVLSPWEEERLKGFRFQKRARDWSLGRLAAKRAVCNLLGLEHGECDFRRISVVSRPDGSPFVELDGAEIEQIKISITHRHDVAMAAACNGCDLGLDMEVVEARSKGFVEQFLSPAEQRLLEACDRDRDIVCNAVWCAKEAVLKAFRLGLSVDTRQVECLPSLDGIGSHGWSMVELHLDSDRFELPVTAWWRRVRADRVVSLAVRSQQVKPPRQV